jgi:hypothetical protein
MNIIDGYPSMNIVDGYPSMIFIDGYPPMNINGYPVLWNPVLRIPFSWQPMKEWMNYSPTFDVCFKWQIRFLLWIGSPGP